MQTRATIPNEAYDLSRARRAERNHRRRTARTLAFAALSALLAACGGGSSGGGGGGGTTPEPDGPPGTGGGGDAGGTTEFITETDISIPNSTRVVVARDPAGASQADLDASSYQIQLFWVGPNGVRFNEQLGTGFAVGGNLIATNAHVSGEVLNRSRRYAQFGYRLDRASAFRAETGDEIPLLRGVVHPSYDGDTRSPDIGLFEARATLPVALKLASNSEVGAVRRGDEIVLNGFPGDVYSAIFARGFMPGLSIPRATFFAGNVQSLQKFDERSVIDPDNPLDIDMMQHSMDTTGGTSGSPILRDGKVVAVHNSGLGFSDVVLGPDGTPTVQRTARATASWGVHVKHLKNLLAEYRTGAMEADKLFRIPIDPAQLQASGGQGGGGGADDDARFAGEFATTITHPDNPDATHEVRMRIDAGGGVQGTSTWPANVAGGARQFTLSGAIDGNGDFEVVDNTPELMPGFRRGLYQGSVSAGTGTVRGEYFELDEQRDEIFFQGSFTTALR